MLNGIKSLGYPTAVGMATGAVVGASVAVGGIPLACGLFAFQAVFLDRFLNGASVSNLDRGAEKFLICAKALPIQGAIAFALVGGAIGLTYGIAKELFKRCKGTTLVELV